MIFVVTSNINWNVWVCVCMCEQRDCGARLIILQGHTGSVWEAHPAPQTYIRTDIMPSNSAAFDVLPLFLWITHLGKHSLSADHNPPHTYSTTILILIIMTPISLHIWYIWKCFSAWHKTFKCWWTTSACLLYFRTSRGFAKATLVCDYIHNNILKCYWVGLEWQNTMMIIVMTSILTKNIATDKILKLIIQGLICMLFLFHNTSKYDQAIMDWFLCCPVLHIKYNIEQIIALLVTGLVIWGIKDISNTGRPWRKTLKDNAQKGVRMVLLMYMQRSAPYLCI